MKKKLFVYGVGRSGTSLLMSILDSHPDICMVPETHFFLKYVANRSRKRKISKKTLGEFQRVLRNDSHFDRIELSIEEVLCGFKDSWQSCTTLDVFNELLYKYKKMYNADIVGVKDPRLIDRLEDLHRFFPCAHVIHIIRDPRDVVLSRNKAEWSSHRSYITHALTYSTQRKRGTRAGNILYGERYKELYYEDLISNTSKVLRRVCSKLKIDYNDNMLNFNDSANRLVGNKEAKWKSKTFGPIRSDNKYKWRDQMSEGRVRVIEYICKDVFTDTRYKREYESERIQEIMLEYLIHSLSRIFHKVYSNIKRMYSAY
jgi:hypothetical protein